MIAKSRNIVEKLKVLHCAPISIEISPNLKYAGTQRIIYSLNRGLSERGVDSYVAGTGDSHLGGYGTLVPTRDNAIWPLSSDGVTRTTRVKDSDRLVRDHYEAVFDIARSLDVDIIHDHGSLAATEKYSSEERSLGIPILTTEHSPITQKNFEKYSRLKALKDSGSNLFYIAISQAHKNSCDRNAGFEFDAFVYNGLPLELLPLKKEKLDYLLWGAARISDKKGTDLAIEIAKRSNRPLIIAGVVHEPDQLFYDEKIRPLVTTSFHGLSEDEAERRRNELTRKISSGENPIKPGEILFVGPVSDFQKAVLYGSAHALAFPNRWEEPFGLSFAESLACGTPVLGTAIGSIPELVEDGKTGFLASVSSGFSDDESIIRYLASKVDDVSSLNPQDSRDKVQRDFSRESMTSGYLEQYRRILNGKK